MLRKKGINVKEDMKENRCKDKNNNLFHFYQMTEDNFNKPEDWPLWLKLSVFIPKDLTVRVTKEDSNKVELEKLIFGYYILRNDKGITKLVSPEEFEEDYERLT